MSMFWFLTVWGFVAWMSGVASAVVIAAVIVGFGPDEVDLDDRQDGEAAP